MKRLDLVVGPNGAGKSTFIDTLSGFTQPHNGTILLDDRDITTARPHERSRAGLVRTFQSLELFDDLTVADNLAVAAHAPTRWSTFTDLLWPKSHDAADVHRVLDLVGLLPLAERFPLELSGGQRQLVALGRALVAEPRLIMLDEPAAGLDPSETETLARLLRTLPDAGVSVLVVDHDMSLIMGVCDRVDVLDFGRMIASGAPAEIRDDPLVIAAYLGSAT